MGLSTTPTLSFIDLRVEFTPDLFLILILTTIIISSVSPVDWKLIQIQYVALLYG